MSERVIINDVGPRDGLQNQTEHLSIEQRVELIRAIQAAGVPEIEAGALVSPRAVPAMAGSDELALKLNDLGVPYSLLIPNRRGYEQALEIGATSVAMVLYGSDDMAEKNVRMSSADAEQATIEMLASAKQDGIRVMATIAVAFTCPFAGATSPSVVRDIAARIIGAGAERVVIADTIGAANPMQVKALMSALVQDHGAEQLACHFHDTRALGLANVYAALEVGVRHFDASIAGLGGCPFAPGATGNVATEDVAMLVQSMGFETGIDLRRLLQASDLAVNLTQTAPGGRAKPWLAPYLEQGKQLN